MWLVDIQNEDREREDKSQKAVRIVKWFCVKSELWLPHACVRIQRPYVEMMDSM